MSNINSSSRYQREAEWLNAWAVLYGADNRQPDLTEAAFADQPLEPLIKEVTGDSLAFLSALIDVQREADPFEEGSVTLMAINSLGWERTDTVYLAGDPLELINPDPTAFAPTHQTVFDDQGRMARLYEVNVPPYGYRVFRTWKGLPGRLIDNPLMAARQSLESAAWRIHFDKQGEIDSLIDLETSYEIVPAGERLNRLVYLDAKGQHPVHDIRDWQVLDSGPLRATIQIVKQIGGGQIEQRISVWRHTRRIDFQTTLNGIAADSTVQAIFPPLQDSPIALIGAEVALSGEHGMILALSVPNQANSDSGDIDLTYSLLIGAQAEQMSRAAAEAAIPLRAIRFRPADSGDLAASLPPVASFVTVDPPEVLIDWIKMAEDGDGLVFCLQAPKHFSGEASILFIQPVLAVAFVDPFEQPINRPPPDVENDHIRFTIQSAEPQYLRIHFKGKKFRHEPRK